MFARRWNKKESVVYHRYPSNSTNSNRVPVVIIKGVSGDLGSAIVQILVSKGYYKLSVSDLPSTSRQADFKR